MATTFLGTLLHDRSPAAITPRAAVDHAQLAAIAFERTRMPMAIADPHAPDSPIVYVNHAFLEQTGYDADEVIGRNCRFLQGPATDAGAVDRIRAAIAREEDLVVELLNYRRNGSTFWNRLLLSPITDDRGRLIYYFSSQQDVTAERRAADIAAREHLLLREVDHRAKNALALVQGIVRLTRADDAREYARTVQRRVDALAAAHVLLSDAGWSAVPLARVVEVAVGRVRRDQIRHHGDPVTIAAAQVQPLMLALHELVTNAVQHGALSLDKGTLAVEWRGTNGEVQIDLTERGGPAPVRPDQPGYGLTIADAFIRRQLRGRVTFAWAATGLETRLVIPAV